MLQISTTLSIIALVIVVHAVAGQVVTVQQDWDQIAQETQAGPPKYVTPKPNYPSSPPPAPDHGRPPNKQNVKTQGQQVEYVERPPRPVYYSQQVHNAPPRSYGNSNPKHMKPNGPYKYPKVIPLNGQHRIQYYNTPPRQSQLAYSASSGKPVYVASTSPKFSLPVQTINGIRSDARPPRPPRNLTTTTTTTTTIRPLRNKRIWPKHILEKMNNTATHDSNITRSINTLTNSTSNSTKDYETSASNVQRRYIVRTANLTTTTTEATTRAYRRVIRVPKHKTTTKPSINSTSHIKQNDWIPLVPVNNYPVKRWVMSNNRRSDSQLEDVSQTQAQDRRMLYLHSVGLVPLRYSTSKISGNNKMVFFRKGKRQLKPKIYSGYSRRPLSRPRRVVYGDLRPEGSHPRVHTKIKHHHHHHHHKYIKTVEKPVKIPYKVEVPYPVPVEKKVPYPVEKIKWVEKKVPYPVQVEKKVPYPVHVRVPQPFPVKVVEKEYVPKPYPVVQQVPVYKEVEVKVPQPVQVTVEKRVPYPVHVQVAVPVDRPVAVPVAVEKKVPYPVPYKVYVPQPYPVETKVPYPVEVKVKEPVEVIKHVKVPVPHPVPVKVPVQVTVEKKVPYPVEVEKRVPVPFRIYVPQRVEVEKKVPVYIPKPYPVEKKVPVPFRVQVPVRVPYEVPIYVGQLTQVEDGYNSVSQSSLESVGGTGLSVSDHSVTQSPHHTVTVHGNGAFTGFSDRSDATTPTPAETTTTS